MNNVVSLICPSCGASIRIDIKQKTGICEFCGREFVCKNALNEPQYKDYQQYENEKQLEGDDW
ncbi:MAG: hypothetical protein FWE25_04550 [Lachnospiraceae bacterium]|nr:hypothetical protein [Lachnospiraceae bacterium]